MATGTRSRYAERLPPLVEDPKSKRLASEVSGKRPSTSTSRPKSHDDVEMLGSDVLSCSVINTCPAPRRQVRWLQSCARQAELSHKKSTSRQTKVACSELRFDEAKWVCTCSASSSPKGADGVNAWSRKKDPTSWQHHQAGPLHVDVIDRVPRERHQHHAVILRSFRSSGGADPRCYAAPIFSCRGHRLLPFISRRG
jgi:hypothetical protein